MFASGNNTERKRMGELQGKDEFVVDLYAVSAIPKLSGLGNRIFHYSDRCTVGGETCSLLRN